MGCKYVKDFDFSSAGKAVGYCGGGRVMKKAEGGKVDLKQDKAMVKAAVHKHEKSMHPGKPLTKLARGGVATPPPQAAAGLARRPVMPGQQANNQRVVAMKKGGAVPGAGLGMVADRSKLGITGNKNPGMKRGVPVAPKLPMIAPNPKAAKLPGAVKSDEAMAMRKGGYAKKK